MRGLLGCLGATMVVAVIACRQLVGIGDQPPGPGGGDAGVEASAACGGFPWAADACTACMDGACCAQASACRADGICAATFDCVARCAGDDVACRAACEGLHDDTLADLAACQASSCVSECGVQCGGVPGLFWPDGVAASLPAACIACLTSGVSCDRAATGAESAGCLAAEGCRDDCNQLDDVCILDCLATHVCPTPDAGAPSDSLDCESQCQWGTNWSCVGHVSWPSGPPPITFQVEIVDIVAGTPIAGAAVSACLNGDTDCSSPLSTATSNSSGVAALTSSTVPFDGYLQIVAADYMAQLDYFDPFLAYSPDPDVVLAIGLRSTTFINELSTSSELDLDPTLGLLLAFPFDCLDNSAPGVSFTASGLGSKAEPFYYVSGTPTKSATMTSTPVAAGGFANVQPGTTTLVASVDGVQVASVLVLTRPKTLTEIPNLVPTP